MAEILAALAVLEPVFMTVAATTAVAGAVNASKANSASRKAASAQRRQEAMAAAIQKRQVIKAARSAAALGIQAGENQGVSGSSGVQGGVGSIMSQLNSNLSFLDQQTQLADYAGGMMDKSSKFSQRATMFNGISNFAMSVNSAAQGAKADKAAKDQQKWLAEKYPGLFPPI